MKPFETSMDKTKKSFPVPEVEMWLFSRVFIMLEIQSVFRISFGDRFGENIKYLIHRRWFGD